uniref:Uncharacterized protein n=1 Tax=Mucochytrium quahogii TaxID=96639 RepID=A0A7S2WHT8_9STRA|mmetsp:Transcript_42571/g.68561  ORF Transcript_42571/g.68561 Transcript_42571/m.68561 type:complete len:131 (+) Transcript_42571:1518-1910(+)
MPVRLKLKRLKGASRLKRVSSRRLTLSFVCRSFNRRLGSRRFGQGKEKDVGSSALWYIPEADSHGSFLSSYWPSEACQRDIKWFLSVLFFQERDGIQTKRSTHTYMSRLEREAKDPVRIKTSLFLLLKKF